MQSILCNTVTHLVLSNPGIGGSLSIYGFLHAPRDIAHVISYRRWRNLCNVKAYSEPYKGGHVHQSEPLEWVTRCKDSAISCNVTQSKGSDWWTWSTLVFYLLRRFHNLPAIPRCSRVGVHLYSQKDCVGPGATVRFVASTFGPPTNTRQIGHIAVLWGSPFSCWQISRARELFADHLVRYGGGCQCDDGFGGCWS